MKGTSYFEKALFFDLNCDANDSYGVSASLVFALESEQSWVDVCVESPVKPLGALAVAAKDATDYHSIHEALVGRRSVNPRKQVPPSWETFRIAEPEQLHAVLEVRIDSNTRSVIADVNIRRQGGASRCSCKTLDHMHVVDLTKYSFVRQRNSFSRLSISQQFFDHLTSEINMFAQFRQYVLCFGRKNGDNEVGPPQLRFRFLRDTLPEIAQLSFGIVSAHLYCSYIGSRQQNVATYSSLSN